MYLTTEKLKKIALHHKAEQSLQIQFVLVAHFSIVFDILHHPTPDNP